MGVNVPTTSSAYEAEVNRVRSEIDQTVKELRLRLTPSSLASEAAAGVGRSWEAAGRNRRALLADRRGSGRVALERAVKGSISAWLPSRRSTEHQIGALLMMREGH